jgi:predicted RNA-binding protein with PIN domain
VRARPMSDAVERDVPLPEAVRVRVVALAAEVLPQVASLPPALRKVAAFAPQRRARLGSTPIAAALTSDPEFREHVVAQVVARRPELADILDDAPSEAADPTDVAAMAWLSRPEGWEDTFAGAVRRLEEGAGSRDTAERGRLQRRLDAAEQSVRDLRAEHRVALEELKAENSALRRKLGEARNAQRSATASSVEVAEAAQEARIRAEAAAAAAEAETRKLRAQVEELQGMLAMARRDVRSGKDEATVRARMLLDTLIEAGQGLRRELALPAVTGAPADRVESALAESGTREPSAAGSLGPSSPLLLEQYLSMPKARLIVDGYNVSKSAWPDSSLEAQRVRLLNGLAPLVARIGAETTVVFDAAASASRPVVNTPRGVKVLFSPEGVIADDVIRELVATEPPGRVVVVVTSDQELARDVARAAARPMSAEALVASLSRSG